MIKIIFVYLLKKELKVDLNVFHSILKLKKPRASSEMSDLERNL